MPPMHATAPLLPEDLVFSQSSLQAFADCPRRFWLTYVQQLPWPAIEISPVQEHVYLMRLGEAFHRAVQRAEIGIDPDLIAPRLQDPVDQWFRDYRAYRPADLPREFTAVETLLAIPLRAAESGPTYRLAAKFDLLAIAPQTRAVIVDWKTTQRRTDPATLRRRLQSQVYPYLLVEASAAMPWGPLAPEQVEMRYWFTAAPDQPVHIGYNAQLHAANHATLQRLLAQILAGQGEEDFPKVPDTEANRQRLCAYCAYRSRCDRGDQPGSMDMLSDPDDLLRDPATAPEFSLDELAELAF